MSVISRGLNNGSTRDDDGCQAVNSATPSTQALCLEAFVRRYPPDVVPGLWNDKLDQLVESGQLVAAYDVLEDLSKRDDGIHAWAKDREQMFVDIDQYETQLKQIMAQFPRLVDTRTGKSGSDPMVIALAYARTLTVVSEESVGSERSPRIPFVCRRLNVRHINLLTLIREQAWTF